MINNLRIKEGLNVINFSNRRQNIFRNIVKTLRKNQVLASIVGDQDEEGLFMTSTGDEEKNIKIVNSIYNKRFEEVICQNSEQ
jgi:hypothetical protein